MKNIKKIETNIKRNLYLNESLNIALSPTPYNLENSIIKINSNFKFQKILGFGGAITESTGYSLSTLKNKEKYNKIIDEYFSKEGLNYNICRLPIGSCDFSLNSYSYSYKEDLSDFNINRDMKYIIPTIKSAQNRNTDIKFISSPWSPPAFMKDNNSLYGGKLLAKHKKTWANYLLKYINLYKNQNINIDYMTIQNEPQANQSWESCLYTSSEEADLLKNYLYPIFKQNNINTKFLIWDHNKDSILERILDIYVEHNALNYISGTAFHWYSGNHFNSLNLINKLFPDKLLIHTEGCTGYSNFKNNDELFNAQMYAYEIAGDLNNGANAFIDWNLVLEYNGGPNHKKNYCNSPIMINKNHTDYIKTPSFYYIAHFSKYIKPHATRIHFNTFTQDICITAFENPDKSIVVVLLNKTDNNLEYNLCINNNMLHDNLDKHAIVTFILD